MPVRNRDPECNNKRFRLSCTVSLRVFVRHNLAFQGDYSAVLAKRMQRNFEPMRRQVESCRTQQLSAEAAKLTIYRAFMEGDLEVPKHMAKRVHELYFKPQQEEFSS